MIENRCTTGNSMLPWNIVIYSSNNCNNSSIYLMEYRFSMWIKPISMIFDYIHIVTSLKIIDNLWALVGLDPITQSTTRITSYIFYSSGSQKSRRRLGWPLLLRSDEFSDDECDAAASWSRSTPAAIARSLCCATTTTTTTTTAISG